MVIFLYLSPFVIMAQEEGFKSDGIDLYLSFVFSTIRLPSANRIIGPRKLYSFVVDVRYSRLMVLNGKYGVSLVKLLSEET